MLAESLKIKVRGENFIGDPPTEYSRKREKYGI